MTGNAIKIVTTWYPVTRPALWRACKTEEEYFQILADRQKKGGQSQSLDIKEIDEQYTVGTLF